MAIKKNTETTINDLQDLQGLLEQQAPAREQEPQLDPVLAKAKEEGFDVNRPHPLVAEFMTGICPFTPEQVQKSLGWILAMVTEATGQDEIMSYEDMVLESHRDPTNFIMAVARQQGKVNLTTLTRLQKLSIREKELTQENTDLGDQISKLKTELDECRTAPDIKKIVADVVNGVVTDVKGVTPVTPAPRLVPAPRLATPVVPRPVKVAQAHVPARTEMVRVQVEEPSIWEATAKAAVVGVVTAGAVYGTIKALEYFFGDDEE